MTSKRKKDNIAEMSKTKTAPHFRTKERVINQRIARNTEEVGDILYKDTDIDPYEATIMKCECFICKKILWSIRSFNEHIREVHPKSASLLKGIPHLAEMCEIPKE